jgi:HPt (histidine-containing phosphotransfer) domain-containing protein
MKKLSNADISTLKSDVESFKERLLDSLYDHYNKIITFTGSNVFRGEAGDSVFNYYNEVHLYILNRMMNVATEIANEAKTMEDAFLSYESSSDGLVNSQLLREKKREINNTLIEFDGLDSEIQRLNGEIMGIAGVSSINGNAVVQQYDDSIQLTTDMADDLEEKDSDVNASLDRLENRVQELKDAIQDVASNFKTNAGFSNYRVDNIQTSDWYSNETTQVYDELYAASPYDHGTADGAFYTTEVGAETDFGTGVAGASVSSYGGAFTRDGTDFQGSGYYNLLEARADLEGDYVEAGANANVVYGSGSVEYSETGLTAEGEAGVAKVDGNVMLGSDEWNVHAEGGAGAFTAEGNVRADTGGIGAKGEVSLVHAEAEGGFTVADTDIDVGVSAGKFGGGAELAWDKIEVELHVGVGGSLSIDFPW